MSLATSSRKAQSLDLLVTITCLEGNGAEYACYRFLKNIITSSSYSIALVSILPGSLESNFRSLGIPVYVILSRDFFKSLRFLLVIVFKTRVKLVHSWMYHACILSQILFCVKNSHILLSVRQALPSYRALRPITLCAAFLSGIIARTKASTIVFNSSRGMQDHVTLLAYPKSRSIVVPNDPFFCPLPAQSSVVPINNYRFLSLARFDESKNLSYMIKLFAYFSSLSESAADLTIYGSGVVEFCPLLPYSPELLTSKRLQLFPFAADIFPLLSSSHIYISTSLWEGYPNSLITAAASGCVPVFTDAGDASLIFTNPFILTGELSNDIDVIQAALGYVSSSSPHERALLYRQQISNYAINYPSLNNIYSSIL